MCVVVGASVNRHRPSFLVRVALGKDASVLEAFEHVPWWSVAAVLSGPLLGLLAWWWSGSTDLALLDSGPSARVMLGIFVLAAAYWITGAIPPFATALLVMGLQVFLLGLEAERMAVMTGVAPGNDVPGVPTGVLGWEQFISPAAAPVVILMLGGMVLGEAAHKHGVDRALAGLFLRPFARTPAMLLLGVILVTATFSMWMSNTATAAMMIAMMTPVVVRLRAELGENSGLARSLMIAVPVGANLGGMGTPIGTPPNAMAFGALRNAGLELTFLDWMVIALPATAAMLLVGWGVLLVFYRPWRDAPMTHAGSVDGGNPDAQPMNLRDIFEPPPNAGWRQFVVAGTFTMVVVLWVTSAWTKIPAAPVAILPVVIFTATRLLDRNDIKRLDWDVLLLVAGGLALGTGMEATGLASWMIGSIPVGSLLGIGGGLALLAGAGLVTVVFSTLMSNTAVANLVLPVALGVVAGTAGAAANAVANAGDTGAVPDAPALPSMLAMGVTIALSASLSMALPVSTPPNAIAAGTGVVRTGDFVRVGVVVGAVGLLVVLGTALFL